MSLLQQRLTVAIVAMGGSLAIAATLVALGPVAAVAVASLPAVALAASRAFALVESDPSRIALPTLLFSVVLLQAPAALGSKPLEVLALVPLVASIAAARARRAPDRATVVSVTLFVLALSLTLVRGALSGAWLGLGSGLLTIVTYAVLAIFGITVFLTADGFERERRLTLLALAPGVFVLTNVAYYLGAQRLGLPLAEPESLAAGTPASLLNELGVGGAVRVTLPLSSGVNSMGAVAATALTLAVCVAVVRREHRLLCALIAAASLYAILLADSRTALAWAAAGIVMLLAFRRVHGASGIAVLLPLSPFILVGVLGLLADSQLADSLSRTGTDFTTATGRTDIWSAAWDGTLSRFSAEQILGWGANGHVTSGASQDYAFVFQGSRDPFTTHNLYLQTILDGGFFGLLLLVGVSGIALVRLSNSDSEVSHLLGGALLVLLLCGMTEAVPTYIFRDTMATFLLLLCADAASPLRGPSYVSHRVTSEPLRIATSRSA